MKAEVFSTVLLSCGLTMFSISVVPANGVGVAKQSAYINDFFSEELKDINEQIANKKALNKTVARQNGGGKILDPQALIVDTDRDPLDVVLRRTVSLLDEIKKKGAPDLKKIESRLNEIKRLNSVTAPGEAEDFSLTRNNLAKEVLSVQRTIALSNPIIDFDTLLFVVTRIGTRGGGLGGAPIDHCVCQYQGYTASMVCGNGGSLYMVANIKSNPVVTDILENTTITNGRLQGRKLTGGAFLSPDLSYDGKTIVFAWRDSGAAPSTAFTGNIRCFDRQYCWNIFKVNVDGSNCVQLTDTTCNEFDPCWLPNGRIAFVSERRGGYGRCHGWMGRTFTIFSMKDDGSDLYCIDYHETNEWHPSVDNRGMIVYSRWDYVDRDAIIAHNMWIMNPDGRDSRAYHGNYPEPLSTIPGSAVGYGNSDGRLNRPMAEMNIRSIPGSDRYIATVSGHHADPYGDLILIDISKPDDNKNSQITGITTNRTQWYDHGPENYATAWPLSEDYYICNYFSDIILLDKFGNRQVIFPLKNIPGVNATYRCLDPMPCRPRPKPQAISPGTYQGERAKLPEHGRAVISVMNVYNSDIPLPAGAKIKELRIVQIIPKTTYPVDVPRTNYASQALCRMSLGTAPVESDGSVFCEAPVGKAVYFQILDDRGCAVQSMRSDTWVHAGEHLTCAGCHEDKWKTVTSKQSPAALQRPPSKLKPEYGTSVEPLTYYRTAKPVLDAKCAPCHKQQGKGPNMSYGSLQNYAFCYDGPQDQIARAPGNGIYHGSRTTPGKHGALQSTLFSHLNSSHHDVSLSAEELRRITLWLDLSSMELGCYTQVSEQQAGRLVWPEMDCDPLAPQGIENDFPVPGPVTTAHGLSSGAVQPLEIKSCGTVITIVNPYRQKVNVSLFNFAGRCVFTRNFERGHARLSFNLQNRTVAPGIYMIKATAGIHGNTVIAAKFF